MAGEQAGMVLSYNPTTQRFDTPAWAGALPPGPGSSTFLVAANNLNDLTDVVAARASLLLGSAALLNTGTAAGQVPVLDSGGKLTSSVLPAIAITNTSVVASQAAMLALTAETGDVAVRTDLNKSFILAGTNPATLSHWQELLTPTDAVLSVNGQTGVIVLTTQHIAEHSSNLYHTPGRVNTLIAAQVGVTIQAYDATLTALAGLNSTPGLLVQTGTDAFTKRALTQPASGFTIANADGAAGDITFTLSDDLAALEALGGQGFAVRVSVNDWEQRSIVQGAGISVTNGDGVSGNPTVTNMGVLSITGTANQVNASAGTGAVTLSLPQNIHTGASPAFAGLVSSGITFNLVNATATTINFGGEATAINVGHPLGITTINSGILSLAGGLFAPATPYGASIGQLSKKFLTAYIGELNVETLVAQHTITTIGGRALVPGGGSNSLIADVGPGDSFIDVKYNNLLTSGTGDLIYFEADGKLEVMRVVTGPAPQGAGYRYGVERNRDGTGANSWPEGSVCVNTAQPGVGFIDLYALRSMKSAAEVGAPYGQEGPTLVGNVRTDTGAFDWTEHWAVGNLKGMYGYGATTFGAAFGRYGNGYSFVSADEANGFRAVARSGGVNTVRFQLAPDGSGFLASNNINWTSAGVIKAGNWTINPTTLNGAATVLDSAGKLTLGTGTDLAVLDAVDSTYRLVIGHSTYASAPFRVTKAGQLMATGVDVAGAVVATSGGIAGDFAIGTSGLLRSGATGALAGSGYWLDYNAGTPRFRVGTVSAGALTKGVYWDGSDLQIKATHFTLNSAGDLTATNVNLSGAFAATSGSVTGDFAVGSGGVLRSGATAVLTGNGYWLDYNGGTPRFRLGTVSGGALTKGLYWDGSDLVINGGGIFSGSLSGATGTFSGTLSSAVFQAGTSTPALAATFGNPVSSNAGVLPLYISNGSPMIGFNTYWSGLTPVYGMTGHAARIYMGASTGSIFFATAASGTPGGILSGDATRLTILNGGNVGVGTTGPEGLFEVRSSGTTDVKYTTSGSAATGRALFQMYRGAASAANGWDFGYNLDFGSENFIIRELTAGGAATRLTMAKGSGTLRLHSDTLRLDTARTPASAGATGNQGDICWDADYVYVCVGSSQWKRAALSTW